MSEAGSALQAKPAMKLPLIQTALEKIVYVVSWLHFYILL